MIDLSVDIAGIKLQNPFMPASGTLGFGDEFMEIPVISLVRKPIHEYQQDNSEVAEDIARGNVVWKPKDEWPRLMKAMADNK